MQPYKIGRFVLRYDKPSPLQKPFKPIVGRLYRGYVGMLWSTRVGYFTVMIYKMQE